MRTCSIEGCNKQYAARGWCITHYKRWNKYGDPNTNNKVSYVQEPTKTPTEVDLAWATGFLEGEGCFEMVRYTQRATATQTHKEPLEKIQSFFGGSLRLHKRTKPNHADCWYWAVCGEKARHVVNLVYPLMSVRRQAQMDPLRN